MPRIPNVKHFKNDDTGIVTVTLSKKDFLMAGLCIRMMHERLLISGKPEIAACFYSLLTEIHHQSMGLDG